MSRTAFLAAALTLATSLGVNACSSGDVKVGASDSALKRKDGTPTGDGTTCSWDNTAAFDGVAAGSSVPKGPFKVGDTFPAPDGCNQCFCSEHGIGCTLMACLPSPGQCTVDGKTYASGTSFPSPDGCNTCTCQDNGSAACTEKACAPAPCVVTGCSGQVCAEVETATDCQYLPVYACYKTATCERQGNGACGWTSTPQLTSCIAENK